MLPMNDLAPRPNKVSAILPPSVAAGCEEGARLDEIQSIGGSQQVFV